MVSIERMPACGYGLRNTFACNIPGTLIKGISRCAGHLVRAVERDDRGAERRGDPVHQPDLILAAVRTASTIIWYPVQRQILAFSHCRISLSSGSGCRARSAFTDRIMPGVQKPHWNALCSRKAR